MGLFTKLFKNKANPDNQQLLKLLGIYSSTNTQESYYNVYQELMNGNSFLMFPTKNKRYSKGDEWTTVEKESILKVASVVNIDGLNTQL